MSAGEVGGCWGASAFHVESMCVMRGSVEASAGTAACEAVAMLTIMSRIGSKLTMPSWRLSSRIALSNAPAAACSPASAHFCTQRWLAGTPGVGTEKSADVPAAGDIPSSAGRSAGRSRSSISHPPLPSSLPSSSSDPLTRGAASPSPSPPRSRSRSSPHPAPPSSSMPSRSAMAGSSPANAPSKKPFETVSSGQLSSRRMGVGGMRRVASPGAAGGSAPMASALLSASSSSPCTLAVR
mmetsp:Transcript_49931/g.159766  ORF Transcript_49931/g.159766 Transcript_49931/m.159766 type:complete len:239 (-) Transcript_49931:2166-2882(-)